MNRRFTLLFGAIGILGGLMYVEFIGCESGCTLRSSPWIMSLYGAFLGGILGSIIDDRKKRGKTRENNQGQSE